MKAFNILKPFIGGVHTTMDIKKKKYLILHNSLQHKHQSDKLQNITRQKK